MPRRRKMAGRRIIRDAERNASLMAMDIGTAHIPSPNRYSSALKRAECHGIALILANIPEGYRLDNNY